MSDTVLEVRNLVKAYGPFRAVDGISFDVPKGKIVGFLGPNGAGKTTTIQILVGVTTHTSGHIKYFGYDFNTHREDCLQKINFTSSYNTLQGRISVMENLIVFAGLYRVKNAQKKIKDLIEYFEIEEIINTRFFDLSAGQKTRVNLIKSLLNDPELLLMDEPTASLDPDIADKTMSLIEQLNKERNLSILYTSHNMDEITRICDEVIFLNHGRIVAQDTPENLTKSITGATLHLTFEDGRETVEKYLNEKGLAYEVEGDHRVSIDTEEKLIPKVLFGLGKAGIYITDIDVEKSTLEDVFLEIARKGKKHV